MKIKITLEGTRYYLKHEDGQLWRYVEAKPGKPRYFTQRCAAEKFIKARAAQGWEAAS